MLKEFLNEVLVPEPLSDDVIRNKYGIKNIIIYRDLGELSDIEELPLDEGLMLFYPIENEYEGHWCLMYRKNGVLEFFDPYGKPPDKWLKFYPPYLTYLLKNYILDGKEFYYSNKRFQKENSNISTCGRWCVGRFRFRNMEIENFTKIFGGKVNFNGDQLISLIIS